MGEEQHPQTRLCPQCEAGDQIATAELVWPVGWSCPTCHHRVETRDGVPIFAPKLADTVSGVDPAMFALLSAHENGNFWLEPRNRLITSLLRRYFPAAESFMEIGCGSGFVLSAIANIRPWRRLVASELHPSGLAIARSRLGNRAEFVQMDARAIPARGVFDAIGAFDVLEHIEEDEAVLGAMYRALRPNGGILLAVPQHPWLWSKFDEHALHVRRYRRGELERKVQDAGFCIAFSGSYTALLLPLMMASRWTASRDRPDSPGKEFELSRIANALLKAALECEVSLTLAGARFPAGGSRVLVARK